MLEGVQEGTLFDCNAVDAESRAASRAASDAGDDAAATCSSRDMAQAARAASRVLQTLPTQARTPIQARTLLFYRF